MAETGPTPATPGSPTAIDTTIPTTTPTRREKWDADRINSAIARAVRQNARLHGRTKDEEAGDENKLEDIRLASANGMSYPAYLNVKALREIRALGIENIEGANDYQKEQVRNAKADANKKFREIENMLLPEEVRKEASLRRQQLEQNIQMSVSARQQVERDVTAAPGTTPFPAQTGPSREKLASDRLSEELIADTALLKSLTAEREKLEGELAKGGMRGAEVQAMQARLDGVLKSIKIVQRNVEDSREQSRRLAQRSTGLRVADDGMITTEPGEGEQETTTPAPALTPTTDAATTGAPVPGITPAATTAPLAAGPTTQPVDTALTDAGGRPVIEAVTTPDITVPQSVPTTTPGMPIGGLTPGTTASTPVSAPNVMAQGGQGNDPATVLGNLDAAAGLGQPQQQMQPAMTGIASPPEAGGGGPINITTREEFDALQPGAKFIFKGRPGIKKRTAAPTPTMPATGMATPI